MQAKELTATRHATAEEYSATRFHLSSAGQATLRNARRQVEIFQASAGPSDLVEWGGAGPGYLAPVDRAAHMAPSVPGMGARGDGAAFVERVVGTAAAEAAFVTIPRKLLRELLDGLDELDLRADRAERGTLRTIRAAMESRLTTLPRTAAEIRTLVAAIAQDITDASDVVQDEARELDQIGFALIMALQALHDIERSAVGSLASPAGIIV